MTDNYSGKQEGHKTYIFDDDDEPTVRERIDDSQYDDEPTIRESSSYKDPNPAPRYKAAFGKASVKTDHKNRNSDEETVRMSDNEGTVRMPYDPEEDIVLEPEAYLVRNSDGKKIWINRSYFYVGSDMGDNDYSIANKYVSRQHAVIRKIGQHDYVIKDLGSMNGTFVDRQGVKPGISKELREGSRVRLADEVFIFHIDR